jgi:hypothetical protein
MFSMTIRDVLWLVLVAWLALAWRLDAQVRDLEMSDGHDNAALFRADNAVLEQANSRQLARIQQLEARVRAQSERFSLNPR